MAIELALTRSSKRVGSMKESAATNIRQPLQGFSFSPGISSSSMWTDAPSLTMLTSSPQMSPQSAERPGFIQQHRYVLPSSPLAHKSDGRLNIADVASSPEVGIETDENEYDSESREFVNHGIGIYAQGNGMAMLAPSYDSNNWKKRSCGSNSIILPRLKTNFARVSKRRPVELVIRNGRATIIASRHDINLPSHPEKRCESLNQVETTSDSDDSDDSDSGEGLRGLQMNSAETECYDSIVGVNRDALSAFARVLARSRANNSGRKRDGSGLCHSLQVTSHSPNFLDSFILSKKGEFPVFASPDSNSLSQKRTAVPVQVGHSTPPSSAFSFDDAMTGFATGMTPYLPTRS